MEKLSLIRKSIFKNILPNAILVFLITIASVQVMATLSTIKSEKHQYNVSHLSIPTTLYSICLYGKSNGLQGGSSVFNVSSADPSLNYSESNKVLTAILSKDIRVKSYGKLSYTYLKYDTKPTQYPPFNTNDNRVLFFSMSKTLACLLNYPVLSGVNFKDYYQTHTENDGTIPVLISSNFAKDHPIGSYYSLPSTYVNSNIKKLLIIGVLDRYTPIYEGYQFTNGLPNQGDTIVLGDLVQLERDKNEGNYNLFFTLKDPKQLSVFEQEVNRVIPIDMACQINEILKDQDSLISSMYSYQSSKILYGVLMLLLSSIGVISISLNSVAKRKKEFGTHLALGATVKDLGLIVVWEIIILYLLAEISCVLYVWSLSFASNDYYIDYSLLIDMFLIHSLLIFVSIAPIGYKFTKLTPIQLLRERN